MRERKLRELDFGWSRMFDEPQRQTFDKTTTGFRHSLFLLSLDRGRVEPGGFEDCSSASNGVGIGKSGFRDGLEAGFFPAPAFERGFEKSVDFLFFCPGDFQDTEGVFGDSFYIPLVEDVFPTNQQEPMFERTVDTDHC